MGIHPTGPKGREDILAAIESELRARGYDGASISDLSQATGLGKSSLYHYFPGGKPEMVAACAEAVSTRMAKRMEALACVSCPREKLAAVFQGFDAYFASGERMCLMAMVANSSAADSLRPLLARTINGTIANVAAILEEGGIPADLARQRAEEAFAQVQGAVLMARATGDTEVFRRLVSSLPDRLLPPA